MADIKQGTVLAPNGKTYTVHTTKEYEGHQPGHGYVYALGHRVYGTFSALSTITLRRTFVPEGKWAFCVAIASDVGAVESVTA